MVPDHIVIHLAARHPGGPIFHPIFGSERGQYVHPSDPVHTRNFRRLKYSLTACCYNRWYYGKYQLVVNRIKEKK